MSIPPHDSNAPSAGPSRPLPPPALAGNNAFAVSVAMLLIRLVLGWTFILHGSQKLFGAFGGLMPGLTASQGMDMFAQGLNGMPVLPPLAWAYMAAWGEFIGGVTVFLGLLARLGSIPILITMFVAIGKVLAPNGFANHFDPKTNQMILGYELNLALVAMAAAVLIIGPGLISIDAILFKRGLWARGPQPLSHPGTRTA